MRERELDALLLGAGVGLRADGPEGEVTQDADPHAVAGRGAVLARAAVVDGLGGDGEPVALELAVDEGGDPPAGDRVPAQFEEAGRHRSGRPGGDGGFE